jgi:hypothetical protein
MYQIYTIEIKNIFESNKCNQSSCLRKNSSFYNDYVWSNKKLKEDFNLSLKFSRVGYICRRNGNYSSMGQIIHISLAI